MYGTDPGASSYLKRRNPPSFSHHSPSIHHHLHQQQPLHVHNLIVHPLKFHASIHVSIYHS
jgi:hypothetical protein